MQLIHDFLKGKSMKIVNIAKNGTVIKDLSKVTVPKKIVVNIAEIVKTKGEKNEK